MSKTALGLHKVLVTAVQGGVGTAAADDDGSAARPAAAGAETLTVTLALPPAGAQKLVFAAEHGSIWLSAEPDDASDAPLPVLTKGNLYR